MDWLSEDETEGLTDADADSEDETDWLRLSLSDGDRLGDSEGERDGDRLGDNDGLTEADVLWLNEELVDSETDDSGASTSSHETSIWPSSAMRWIRSAVQSVIASRSSVVSA